MNDADYYKVSIDGEQIECIDLIEALLERKAFQRVVAFDYGNVIKYMFRVGNKGDFNDWIEDLNKAKQYLEHMIDTMSGELHD